MRAQASDVLALGSFTLHLRHIVLEFAWERVEMTTPVRSSSQSGSCDGRGGAKSRRKHALAHAEAHALAHAEAHAQGMARTYKNKIRSLGERQRGQRIVKNGRRNNEEDEMDYNECGGESKSRGKRRGRLETEEKARTRRGGEGEREEECV
eukprot:5430317-Pleurochrysis_carterae.AAC.1